MGNDHQKDWLKEYLERYRTALLGEEVLNLIIQLRYFFEDRQSQGKKAIFAGNGGSAAIASHCAVDFTKSAGIRCVNFNEPDLITCLANDYGYELWLQKAIELYADDGDLVVLISSSGQSANMVEAARYTRARGLTTVTFTGFRPDNPLRSLGVLNFWVDSRAYNVVEMTHHIWLLSACDLIIGKAEYPARREL